MRTNTWRRARVTDVDSAGNFPGIQRLFFSVARIQNLCDMLGGTEMAETMKAARGTMITVTRQETPEEDGMGWDGMGICLLFLEADICTYQTVCRRPRLFSDTTPPPLGQHRTSPPPPPPPPVLAAIPAAFCSRPLRSANRQFRVIRACSEPSPVFLKKYSVYSNLVSERRCCR